MTPGDKENNSPPTPGAIEDDEFLPLVFSPARKGKRAADLKKSPVFFTRKKRRSVILRQLIIVSC